MTILVWLRQDLRVEDNPALFHASQKGVGVIALTILTEKTWQRHDKAVCQINFLKDNLKQLEKRLAHYHIPLVVKKTDYYSESVQVIAQMIDQFSIKALYFNEQIEWDERRRDALVEKKLKDKLEIHRYQEAALITPGELNTSQGAPYKVFTPFKKAAIEVLAASHDKYWPLAMPKKQKKSIDVKQDNASLAKESCNQDTSWCEVGEEAAKQQLDDFIENQVHSYKQQRDIPSIEATSRLSPYFALGILSPRMAIKALLEKKSWTDITQVSTCEGSSTWLSELLWRDFYKMITYCFPRVSRNQPFLLKTKALKWDDNKQKFERWCQGETGVPIIDAAMRQLNQTGWMHNRLRMIVAMYLTKNLWINWQWGEAYFMSKLIDGDFSANNGGWQWSAGTGVDAAPYFRIFNPVTQSERFDPDGRFIRQYLPQLAKLDNKAIHNPSETLRRDYNYVPMLVDLKTSRAQAIAAFKQLG